MTTIMTPIHQHTIIQLGQVAIITITQIITTIVQEYITIQHLITGMGNIIITVNNF